jgi:hypothetical protein
VKKKWEKLSVRKFFPGHTPNQKFFLCKQAGKKQKLIETKKGPVSGQGLIFC